MVGCDAYVANLWLVDHTLAGTGLGSGCIIECGTWRGGMAAGLMSVGGEGREYFFFDSFRGLPSPGVEDGDEARRWRANKRGPRYFNNCTASLKEFEAVIAKTRIPKDHIHVHEGWFEETFPDALVPPISVLRLDVDWFKSTMICFEKFWDLLLPGAIVLLDDYYDWEGCRKAVHSFLSRTNACEGIRESSFGEVAYIVKS
jgi:hypothetical protein